MIGFIEEQRGRERKRERGRGMKRKRENIGKTKKVRGKEETID